MHAWYRGGWNTALHSLVRTSGMGRVWEPLHANTSSDLEATGTSLQHTLVCFSIDPSCLQRPSWILHSEYSIASLSIHDHLSMFQLFHSQLPIYKAHTYTCTTDAMLLASFLGNMGEESSQQMRLKSWHVLYNTKSVLTVSLSQTLSLFAYCN